MNFRLAFSDDYETSDQPNLKFLPQVFNYRPSVDVDKIERDYNMILIPNVANKIKTILEENKYDIEIPEESERESNVYHF